MFYLSECMFKAHLCAAAKSTQVLETELCDHSNDSDEVFHSEPYS